jgi:predicted anti-sigma-YlaC factor YlaD
MSCDEFEDLLPLYVEGDLAGEEGRRVGEHLAVCATCRESLAFYRELESSLVSRRDLRPSPKRTATVVSERLGLRKRWRPLDAWVGVPAVASAGFILLGLVLLVFRDAVTEFFGGVAENVVVRFGQGFSAGSSRALEAWTRGVDQLVGVGNEWLLLSVYAGVFALIMLTGSWMVLRFVRE